MSISTFFIPDQLREYMLATSVREHPALLHCRERTSRMSTAGMQISPEQGQFMALLMKLIGAKKTLEIGVFTGYSSTAVALALPDDGKLIAIDSNFEWTNLARKFWQEAGVENKIELILERADLALYDLIEAGETGSFDFIFIDADKKNYDQYYEQALKLIRPGGLIALDNALMGGGVFDSDITDENTLAVRALNEKLLQDDRVDISLLPIGDGLFLCCKI